MWILWILLIVQVKQRTKYGTRYKYTLQNLWTSRYEWKGLAWDDKLQTKKNKIKVFYSDKIRRRVKSFMLSMLSCKCWWSQWLMQIKKKHNLELELVIFFKSDVFWHSDFIQNWKMTQIALRLLFFLMKVIK